MSICVATRNLPSLVINKHCINLISTSFGYIWIVQYYKQSKGAKEPSKLQPSTIGNHVDTRNIYSSVITKHCICFNSTTFCYIEILRYYKQSNGAKEFNSWTIKFYVATRNLPSLVINKHCISFLSTTFSYMGIVQYYKPSDRAKEPS